jgi:hypothetical protein
MVEDLRTRSKRSQSFRPPFPAWELISQKIKDGQAAAFGRLPEDAPMTEILPGHTPAIASWHWEAFDNLEKLFADNEFALQELKIVRDERTALGGAYRRLEQARQWDYKWLTLLIGGVLLAGLTIPVLTGRQTAVLASIATIFLVGALIWEMRERRRLEEELRGEIQERRRLQGAEVQREQWRALAVRLEAELAEIRSLR